MKLSKYLRIEDIPRKQFAERLGVHKNTIHLLCSKNPRRCGAVLALKIVEATGGAVTLDDLLGSGVTKTK